MEFPFEEVLSGAALILAVASPVITAAINSHTQKREREAGFYTKTQAETIENYLKSTSAFICYPTDGNREAYGRSRALVTLVVNQESSAKIMQLDSSLIRYRFNSRENEAQLAEMLHDISDSLRKEYPRLIKRRRNRHAK